jgi:hypothetical protein
MSAVIVNDDASIAPAEAAVQRVGGGRAATLFEQSAESALPPLNGTNETQTLEPKNEGYFGLLVLNSTSRMASTASLTPIVVPGAGMP